VKRIGRRGRCRQQLAGVLWHMQRIVVIVWIGSRKGCLLTVLEANIIWDCQSRLYNFICSFNMCAFAKESSVLKHRLFLPQCSSIHCLSLLLQWDTGSWLLAIYVLPMSIDLVTLQLRYSCNALCHVISIGTIYLELFTLTIARRLGVSVLPP
jgi:hypothetical protein